MCYYSICYYSSLFLPAPEFVCPALGFMEFLHFDWLRQILGWQKPNGCFGRMPPTEFGRKYKEQQHLDYQYEGENEVTSIVQESDAHAQHLQLHGQTEEDVAVAKNMPLSDHLALLDRLAQTNQGWLGRSLSTEVRDAAQAISNTAVIQRSIGTDNRLHLVGTPSNETSGVIYPRLKTKHRNKPTYGRPGGATGADLVHRPGTGRVKHFNQKYSQQTLQHQLYRSHNQPDKHSQQQLRVRTSRNGKNLGQKKLVQDNNYKLEQLNYQQKVVGPLSIQHKHVQQQHQQQQPSKIRQKSLQKAGSHGNQHSGPPQPKIAAPSREQQQTKQLRHSVVPDTKPQEPHTGEGRNSNPGGRRLLVEKSLDGKLKWEYSLTKGAQQAFQEWWFSNSFKSFENQNVLEWRGGSGSAFT